MKKIILYIFLSIQIFVAAQTKTKIDEVNNISFVNLIKDLNNSKKIFKQNIKDAQKLGYTQGEVVAYEKLSIVHFYLKEVDLGMKVCLKAIEYYEENGMSKKLMNLYASVGFGIKEENLELGLEFFRKAIKLANENDFGLEEESVYNNYGVFQKIQGDLDSALFFHLKAVEIQKLYKDSIAIPYGLNHVATIYSAQGNYEKAFKILDESDVYRKLENNDLNWADNLAYRADVFFDMKEYDSAAIIYNQSLVLANKTNFTNLSKYCNGQLSKCFEFLGETGKALKHFKALQTIKDSIYSIETEKAIALLETDYKVAQKEKVIAEQGLELSEKRRTQMMVTSILALVILIAVFIYVFQKRKRLSEINRAEIEKELQKSKLEKEFVDEKLRIGRELHDNIGAQLTFIISSVDNLGYVNNQDKVKDRLRNLGDFGRDTMKELRGTIWAMNSEGGSIEDLILKINDLQLNMPDSLKIEVINDVVSETSFNALQLLNLYRIVQESLQNSVKYSQAVKSIIKFKEKEGEFSLEISDNGKGFNLDEIIEGNGLNNMRKRAEELNGVLNIESGSSGTKISCRINGIRKTS